MIACGNSGHATFGGNPFEDESNDINREDRRGVVDRVFVCLDFVGEHRGQRITLREEAFPDDDKRDAGGPSVLLCPRVHQVKVCMLAHPSKDIG